MTSIRLHRSHWWLMIPAGWALVGVVGHWLVLPMVLLTVFLGTGLSRHGRAARLQCRRDHEQRHQQHFESGQAPWEQRHTVAAPQPAPRVDLAKQEPDTLTSLTALSDLPTDVRQRAQRLEHECSETLTYLRKHGAPTAQVFEVEQIQTDFGPQALRSYLALAPGTADTLEVLEGKTAHQLVIEQLDLLLAQVAAHLHRAARLGTDELLANHRFLTEKFGPGGDSELTI
ncbi:hypothetical protein [Flexivirga lutea]